MKLERAEPIANPCPACNGTGSDWPTKKDGTPDQRHRWPVGPCRACNGTGRADPPGQRIVIGEPGEIRTIRLPAGHSLCGEAIRGIEHPPHNAGAFTCPGWPVDG